MPDLPKIDIRPDHWEIVQGILKKHVPLYEVWAFGSRAKWTAKEYSDLDLAIITDRPLSLDVSASLSDDFSESDLPWRVDVVDWATTSESFRKIIERDKVVVQEGKKGGGMGEWPEVTIESIATRIAMGPFGSDIKTDNFVPMGVPIIRGGNLTKDRFHSEGFVFLTEEKANDLLNANAFPGDLVFTHRGTLGQVGLIPEQPFPRYVVSQSQMKLACDKHKALPEFIYYFFKSPIGQNALLVNTSQTGVPAISRPVTSLKTIQLRLPPLGEQRAIAHILGTLDDKIELNRKQNETLEAMARALFKAWFVDFEPVRAKMEGRWVRGQSLPGLPAHLYDLFPDKLVESELGVIPEGWVVGKIRDCCVQIQNGGTPRRNESRFWDNGNIPWLASGEVRQSIITATESFITEDGLAESSAKWVPAFSTVVALYGATAGQVSLTSFPLTTNQAVCALIPKQSYAFFNYLAMRRATADMENKAVGSAQQNISKGIVENTDVVLPSSALIQRFAQVVNPLFDGWIANLYQSGSLSQLRDTLLPKLISGELRVPAAMVEGIT